MEWISHVLLHTLSISHIPHSLLYPTSAQSIVFPKLYLSLHITHSIHPFKYYLSLYSIYISIYYSANICLSIRIFLGLSSLPSLYSNDDLIPPFRIFRPRVMLSNKKARKYNPMKINGVWIYYTNRTHFHLNDFFFFL